MSFVINFWYEPKKHKNKYLTGKIINWKTFSAGNIKYSVSSKGSSLILVANPKTKKEATLFKHFLRMNPDKKHMIVLTSDGKTVNVLLDNRSIKTVTLPQAKLGTAVEKIYRLPKIEKPKKAKVKKPKPKKAKTKPKVKAKPKTPKPKTTKPKVKAKIKTKITKSKKVKPKKVTPKKKKPKRLKPRKLKPKK